MNTKSAVVAPVVVAVLATACTPSEPDRGCDRNCLLALADGYLGALAARDPEAVPVTERIGFVENVKSLKLGEGLWASAAGAATGFRIYVPDPEQSSVGIMAVIERQTEGGIAPALLAVRLRVEAGTITEAEHLVADVPTEAEPARLEKPRANLTAVVPESERMLHAEIAAIAASYYEALVQSDGSLAPFAADCEREENGLITAGYSLSPASFDSVDVNGRSPPPVARDCAGQMSSRRFAYIDSIDNRRIFAVDPVQGLAMGLSHFRQSMRRGPQRMVAADGTDVMWEERRDPYDLPAAHIFKITGGEIHEVEALGIFVPYGSATGWE
jgi:hypothetical protein